MNVCVCVCVCVCACVHVHVHVCVTYFTVFRSQYLPVQGVANEDSDEMDHTLVPWKHAYGTGIVFLWRDQVCDESS